MDCLLVDPRYRVLFLQLQLKTHASVTALLGENKTGDRRQVLVATRALPPSAHDAVQLYYKQYFHPSPSWRFWIRPSKARREYANYAVFEQLGVACAQRVACGESRDWLGRLRHAFILTRAIPQTITLLDFSRALPPLRDIQVRAVRAAVASQLAQMVRRLHEARFFHNDLYWRNILVQHRDGDLPRLWWIDCPRGRFSRRSLACRRRRVKDLAALDLEAAKHCSRTERVRFLLEYLGSHTLGQRGKQLARDIVTYRRHRWPAKNAGE
jgi:tRNA A-37 threonylcarbamoyl transferase component Bud32